MCHVTNYAENSNLISAHFTQWCTFAITNYLENEKKKPQTWQFFQTTMTLLDIFLSCPVYLSCSTWMFKDYMADGQCGDVGKIWKIRKRGKIQYIEGHYRLQWEDCEMWWGSKKMLYIHCILGKGSHQVHGLVGAVLWNAEFLMYHQYWKL